MPPSIKSPARPSPPASLTSPRKTLTMRAAVTSILLVACATSAGAQVLPPERTYDIVVSDSSADLLIRLADRTQNGTYNVVGEHSVFYDDLDSDGGPALSTASSLAYDSRGTLFVADTGLDAILRMKDADGDGKARLSTQDEWAVFLDGTNFAGIAFPSILTIIFTPGDVLYGVNSGVSASPLDFVFRAEDLNGDGDANDVGEVTIVYDGTTGSIPVATPFGLAYEASTGDLFISDVNPDAVYRLHDGDSNGDFYGAGEITSVYTGIDATAPGLMNANRLRFAPDGTLLLNDATLDMIIALRDLTTDGDYDDPNEATIFADKSGNSFNVPANQFDIQVDENGVVFACENSALDGIIRYEDLNNDGDANDPGETTIVYDNAVGPGSIALPRALALVPAPTLKDQGNGTAQIGGTLSLDLEGFAGDTYVMVIGATPLAGLTPVPPYGEIGFIPLIVLLNGTLDANGDAAFAFPVPSGSVPPGLIVHFAALVGKAPFRQYLTNDLQIFFQ